MMGQTSTLESLGLHNDSMPGRERIRNAVQQLDDLPSLPVVANRLLHLLTRGYPDLNNITELIQLDPALSMKVLRQANSLRRGTHPLVSSIAEAVSQVERSQLRCTLLNVMIPDSLVESLRRKSTEVQEATRKHALTCALAAKLLANEIAPELASRAYACGLLHDIGKLVLNECLPGPSPRMSDPSSRSGPDSIPVEQAVWGVDHSTVGKWLAEQWRLPEELVHPIWLHHHPLRILETMDFIPPERKELILIVHLADTVAHGTRPPTRLQSPLGHLLEHFNLTPAKLDELRRCVLERSAEKAAFLQSDGNDLPHYFHALQKANQTLTRLATRSPHLQALERTHFRMRRLHDLNIRLSSSKGREHVLEEVLHELAGNMGFAEGVIYFMDRRTHELTGRHWTAQMPFTSFHLSLHASQQSIRGELPPFQEPLAHLIESACERFAQESAEDLMQQEPVRRRPPYLIVPLNDGEGFVGEILLKEPDKWPRRVLTSEELDMYHYLAVITAMAFSRAQLVEKLRENAEMLNSALSKAGRVIQILEATKQHFENLFQYSSDAVVLHDLNGAILSVNRRAQELLGLEQAQFTGESLFALLPPDRRKEGKEELTEAWRSRQGSQIEIQLVRKDGKVRQMEIGSRIMDKSSGLVQSILRDVTDRKKTEEELLRAQKLESIGVMVGGIAHDFNNLMAVVLGNIELARMRMGDPDAVQKRLETAEKAVKGARSLTQQLLTFSKNGTVAKETASVATILEESCEFILRGSSIKCHFHCPEDLWPAEINVGQMSQVLNNLMINARQAMEKGGCINVSAENVEVAEQKGPLKPGKYVKITIQDQGDGIPEEHLDKIFDPYFTTKQRENTTGRGLGLAVVYSVIRKHDGHITVDSRLGRGATFHIHLPASQKKVMYKQNESKALIKGQGRVLIMDDEEVIRETLGEMVALMGYQVDFAADGTEAVDLYKEAAKAERPFDAVIMDLTVPGGLGGEEAAKEILEMDSDAKILLSSGYANEPIQSNYEGYGFKGILTKPYKMADLSTALHRLMSGTPVHDHEL